MEIPIPLPEDPSSKEKIQPSNHESTPIPESDLSKWAHILRFESDEEMTLLESEIVNPKLVKPALHDPERTRQHLSKYENRVRKLLAEYEFRAYQIIVDKEKRNAEDSLALILQSAHFHYIKGMYLALLNDFENINELFDNPEIDDDLYESVGEVMKTTRIDIATQLIPQVPRVELEGMSRKELEEILRKILA